MVGSFFAMPHLPKIRFNSNFVCKDTTNHNTFMSIMIPHYIENGNTRFGESRAYFFLAAR